MDKEYFIEINGRQIPVSKEVYYAFKRPAWRERKRRQVRAEKELSLEAFADAGFEIPSGQALVDEIVEDKLLLWIYVNIVDTKTQIFMQFFLKHLQAVEESYNRYCYEAFFCCTRILYIQI